ncbi:PKD domain-containing protein, partial [Candidatus Saccharibacteria bacterium]|nr:PKD domain-containing protein [Candidatus Saccharibacteria bacterium]
MIGRIRHSAQWTLSTLVGACLLALFVFVYEVSAITQLPIPSPIPGSYGLEATKRKPPPTEAATLTTPGNGASFTTSPITVNGICPKDLLVQVYNNGVFVGSVLCKTGSFSIQVTLFAGTNELTAIVYDELDQAGPVSNSITVTYTDLRLTAFGQLITLTSSYGRRSAPAGQTLSWPLQLAGGTGPYAFSIDWGDGSAADLKSQALPGVVSINHVYKKAGVYQVNVRVTDTNGVSAFIQLVAVASGKVDASTANTGDKTSGGPATTPPQ